MPPQPSNPGGCYELCQMASGPGSITKRICSIARPFRTAFALFALIPLVFILMVFLIFWALSYFESTATQREMTITAMVVGEERIFDFIHQHQTLPKNLSELPQTDGKIDGTKDGWGRPILYIIGKNDAVTLMSLGSDGKPGGSGEAADIIESFQTKNTNGNWIQAISFKIP
jgi:hypothetical protein